MKSRIRTIVSVAGIATVVATMSPAIAGSYPQVDLGYPANADTYTRVVAVDANTRWVNVNHNEIVRFENASDGTNFTWRFYTPAKSFQLSDVTTPGNTGRRSPMVYVSDNRDVGG